MKQQFCGKLSNIFPKLDRHLLRQRSYTRMSKKNYLSSHPFWVGKAHLTCSVPLPTVKQVETGMFL